MKNDCFTRKKRWLAVTVFSGDHRSKGPVQFFKVSLATFKKSVIPACHALLMAIHCSLMSLNPCCMGRYVMCMRALMTHGRVLRVEMSATLPGSALDRNVLGCGLSSDLSPSTAHLTVLGLRGK